MKVDLNLEALAERFLIKGELIPTEHPEERNARLTNMIADGWVKRIKEIVTFGIAITGLWFAASTCAGIIASASASPDDRK